MEREIKQSKANFNLTCFSPGWAVTKLGPNVGILDDEKQDNWINLMKQNLKRSYQEYL